VAKHVILERYTFNPSTRTVEILGKFIRKEQLILITNVTTNTVIYNFADSALGSTNYVATTANNEERTTIVLTYNTSGMGGTDKLSIIVDETNETFYPAESMMDANTKLRVTTPQALIDTDFEYGTQPTKWETISLLNNRPSAFYDNTTPLNITNITGAGTRIVTVTHTGTPAIAPTTSTPIFIQDSTNPDANGWYIPATAAVGTFTYVANDVIPSGSIFDATKTYVYVGTFYTGSGITVPTGAGAAFTYSGNNISCTTTYAHGLSVGDAIFVVGTTATTNPPNGAWIVRTTPTNNTFTFTALNTPTGNISALAITSLFNRPWGDSIHRPFDGGVEFSCGAPYHGNQLIRQTRRYFRYQSGKAIMFSTGSNMTAPFKLDNLTSSGNVVTVKTKFPHNLGIGAVISVSGANESGYNGVFTVTDIPTTKTFTYETTGIPGAAEASGPYIVQPKNWYGAYVRIGMFDQQNGFYFEYDGQEISACRRSSTFQLSGHISVLANGNTQATGVESKWSRELTSGDFIVIRGMSYTVMNIQSDTSMTIYPEYRGTSISSPSQCIISRTDIFKVPQSEWNIDRCDGTGSSGYNVDINKMQMWLIDYSWYGAGAIRFGFKNHRGEWVYCHRMAHANDQTEAYMRSGNLPARYEVSTITVYTKLTSTLSAGETSAINVVSTQGFPESGVAIITGSDATGAPIEYIRYTSKTSTSLLGLTRGVINLSGPKGLVDGGGSSSPVTFTFSETAPTSVTFFSPECSNTISHWGSSVLMDGRYDDDKSYVFVAGMATTVSTIATTKVQPLISLRLGPSVDNGLIGLLGSRELINRAQLVLRGMGAFTTGSGFLMTLRLNSVFTGTTQFQSVGVISGSGSPSLAQVAIHAAADTIVANSGEIIFGFYTNATGVTTQDLSTVRDLGNSILGGGTLLTIPTTRNNRYPDGPDIVTLCAQPLGATNSINARITWTEAQA
jgi:hypothetical protein